MPPQKKVMNDRAAGEIMLKEVFNVIERLNATAGPAMALKGTKKGNMTFNPKIVVDEVGCKQYTCYIEIYTPKSVDDGPDITMECSAADVEQFKQTLTTIFTALSGLAKECYISDTYTVGLIKPDSDEVEIYAPAVLEPGMYSLKED